jgi:lactoylglutathione lyase
MKPRINMIGILTDQFEVMRDFYRDVMGFEIKLEMENFVEFESEGVRFALSTNEVMTMATGNESFRSPKSGHAFELAFQASSKEAMDKEFDELIEKGATSIKTPADMPWRQRTAFFADPDGNIHELFIDIPTA